MSGFEPADLETFTCLRLAREAGVKVAITTDAHSVRDFRYLRYGIDQARRAGFSKESILNHYSWPNLKKTLKRF